MTLQRTLAFLASLAVGIGFGFLGTFGHRSVMPWGLVLALIACIAAGVWVRATFGAMPVMAYLVGWAVAVQVLAAGGPGGDVQVVADATGYVWAYGTVALLLAVLWLPRSWFADTEASLGGIRGQQHTAADVADESQNVG